MGCGFPTLVSYNGHEADLEILRQPHNKYGNSYFKGFLQEFHIKKLKISLQNLSNMYNTFIAFFKFNYPKKLESRNP